MRERKARPSGETALTPAISLIVGLRESLRMIKEEGLESVRCAMAGSPTPRAPPRALGLELFSSSPTFAVTAFAAPNGLDGSAVVTQLRIKYGITIAGGQDASRGRSTASPTSGS